MNVLDILILLREQTDTLSRNDINTMLDKCIEILSETNGFTVEGMGINYETNIS